MLPHQQRVVDERDELVSKAAKLYDFIDDENPVCGQLEPAEKERLTRQHSLMVQYAEVLDDRIAAFAK